MLGFFRYLENYFTLAAQHMAMKFSLCLIVILAMSINFSCAQLYDLQAITNTSLGNWKDFINLDEIKINNISDIKWLINDSDKDRIPDVVEKYGYIETDPYKKDTDEDGISDYEEIMGIRGHRTDPTKNDTDDDGLFDLREYWWLCDPTNAYSAGLDANDGELLKEKRAPFLRERLTETTDSDNDGLPDAAEINEIGTDSRRFSTDGDQFSDGDEYFGLNMPQISPADHYFLSAYPKISIKLVRIDVTPKNTIQSMSGGSIGRGWSINEETSNTLDFDISPEGRVELSPAKLLEGGLLNPKAWAEAASIELGCSVDWKETYSVVKSNTTSGWDETSWSTATTTDSGRAAELNAILEITNSGNQPAKDITFDLDLLLNDKLIKTISVSGDRKISLLGVGKATERSVDGIFVTLDQLMNIDAGASLKIRPSNIRYNVNRWCENQWCPTETPYGDYLEEVERCTSTLILDSGNQFNKEYKVYSGNPTRSVTLRDAINLTVIDDSILQVTANGNLDLVIPEAANESVRELMEMNQSILDIELKPGWIIVLSDSTAKIDKGMDVRDPYALLKAMSFTFADRLTSYSIKTSMTQTLKLDSRSNATAEKSTTITENAETVAVVNLSSLEAHATGSTKNQMEITGQPANTSTTSANVYQIGNSTYVNDESGNWTHLADPRSKQEVWGPDKNNQVKAIAATFNLSTTEDLGSEAISGEDAYKLKIVTGGGDNISLQNAAFAIAAKVTQYPMYLPSVNRTELNETGKIEKTIWISKKSYLPVKYQSIMSFSMTPEIIGALDPNTSQMKMFNQSLRLGEISVSIETDDLYYDFDKPTDITLPEQAFSAPVITPTQAQANAAT